MPLNDQQRHDILFHLGYSDKTLEVNSTDYVSSIAKRLDNLSVSTEKRITSLIQDIDALEDKMRDAWDRLTATEVGDIKLRQDELVQLKNEQRRLKKLMSLLLGIPITGASSGTVGVRI